MGMMLKPVEIQDDSRKKEKANCNYCVRGLQNEIYLSSKWCGSKGIDFECATKE
jgi:hypothetical protein